MVGWLARPNRPVIESGFEWFLSPSFNFLLHYYFKTFSAFEKGLGFGLGLALGPTPGKVLGYAPCHKIRICLCTC